MGIGKNWDEIYYNRNMVLYLNMKTNHLKRTYPSFLLRALRPFDGDGTLSMYYLHRLRQCNC